jgi:DNA-binding CsgD family transcriptional regulator
MSYIEPATVAIAADRRLPADSLLSPAEFPENWRSFLKTLHNLAPGCGVEAAWENPWSSGPAFTLPAGRPLPDFGAEKGHEGDFITIAVDGPRNTHARLRLARCTASPERWEELHRLVSLRTPRIREGLTAGQYALIADASTSLVAAMIEHSARPALLLAADGQVQLMNAEAKHALAQDRGISISAENRLSLHARAEKQKLYDLIGVLAMRFARDGRAQGAMRFHAPDQHEIHGLQLKLVAPPPAQDVRVYATGPWIVATIHFHDMPARLAAELLSSALDLTPAEAQLVAALASGRSLQHYADSAELKITTVRWHLRNVLRRTGLHSQTELVAFVLSLLS